MGGALVVVLGGAVVVVAGGAVVVVVGVSVGHGIGVVRVVDVRSQVPTENDVQTDRLLHCHCYYRQPIQEDFNQYQSLIMGCNETHVVKPCLNWSVRAQIKAEMKLNSDLDKSLSQFLNAIREFLVKMSCCSH